MRTRAEDVKGLGRLVRGQVSASGGIVSGSGFAVVRNSVGNYTITFLQPFKAPPIIVASIYTNGNVVLVVNLSIPPTAALFSVATFLPTNGAGSDQAFFFIAEEVDPA